MANKRQNVTFVTLPNEDFAPNFGKPPVARLIPSFETEAG